MIFCPSVTLAPLAHTCGPLLFSSSFGATGVSGLSSSSRSPISGFVVSLFLVTVIFAVTSSLNYLDKLQLLEFLQVFFHHHQLECT